MKKKECDRIIVSSNEKMEKVIRWYLDNQKLLDIGGFHAPMESGLIVLEEENIEVMFESKENDTTEIKVYPLGIDTPALTYDYHPNSKSFSNYKFPDNISPQKRMIMQMVAKQDRTDYKEAIKYHSLMMFSVYYKEMIPEDTSQRKPRTKHEAKRIKAKGKPLQLAKKTYILSKIEEEKLTECGEKRPYTKPDHEVQVKGFFRTSKSGKRSWIKPFSRYKDRGTKKRRDYKV